MTAQNESDLVSDGPRASKFVSYFQREENLVVPTIVLYEVYKKLLSGRSSKAADRFLSAALRARVMPFDEQVALFAARVSLEHRLAMADAMVYAAALATDSHLITLDAHFRNLPGATVIGTE